MGPSTRIDGDVQDPREVDRGEAASMGRRLASTETSPACCGARARIGFNGAVDSHRRRLGQAPPPRGYRERLQWGRRLASTETSSSPDLLTTSRRFNGAVDSHRRRLGGAGPGATKRAASMGPSTRIDGDTAGMVMGLRWCGRLQWGRRLASTETSASSRSESCSRRFNGAVDSHRRRQAHQRAGRRRPHRASMGPSTRIDGDDRGVPATPRSHAASMGPSTRIDGDVATGDELERVVLASMGPSTRIDGDQFYGLVLGDVVKVLQWGRRLASTETLSFDAWDAEEQLASMGPSTRIDGDISNRPVVAPRARLLQGARVPASPTRCSSPRGRPRYSRLQWGRRLASTETEAGLRSADAGRPASMGPSTRIDGDTGSRG